MFSICKILRPGEKALLRASGEPILIRQYDPTRGYRVVLDDGSSFWTAASDVAPESRGESAEGVPSEPKKEARRCTEKPRRHVVRGAPSKRVRPGRRKEAKVAVDDNDEDHAVFALHCVGRVKGMLRIGSKDIEIDQACDRSISGRRAHQIGDDFFCSDCARAQTAAMERFARQLARVRGSLLEGEITIPTAIEILDRYTSTAAEGVKRGARPSDVTEPAENLL